MNISNIKKYGYRNIINKERMLKIVRYNATSIQSKIINI